MTESDETYPETEATEPARIPNVRPGAVSGLDHAPLGDEATLYGDAVPDDEGSTGTSDGVVDLDLPDSDGEVTVIAGTPEERLAWVRAAETHDEASKRAEAIYRHEVDAGASEQELSDLGGQLTAAVYSVSEKPDEGATGTDDGTEPDAADQKTEGSDDGTVEGNSIPGELVESETAGTGEAVTTNPETGETVVTPPGEPLPPIEQEGGNPLDPPQPGADEDGFGGDAPEPAEPPTNTPPTS